MHEDDAPLVADCLTGAREAWERLVRAHIDRMHRAVSRLVPAVDADDVIQRTFVSLFVDDHRRLRAFEGRSRLSTWLVAIARRQALDWRRARGLPELPEPNPAPDPLDTLAHAESREQLDAALRALPARDRILLQLVYLDGASYGQTARLLGVAENSISPWLGRARARLRAQLEQPAPIPCTDPPQRPIEGGRTP